MDQGEEAKSSTMPTMSLKNQSSYKPATLDMPDADSDSDSSWGSLGLGEAIKRLDVLGLEEATGRLSRNDRRLRHLRLTFDNNIDGEGARALADALTKNTTLKDLDLGGNNIDAEGARALADALKKNFTLTKLRLICTDIGDDVSRALADALTKNSALEVLDLGGNNIGDEGAEALAGALKKNSTLKDLILSQNNIGDEGASALADALVINNTLTHLHLESNSIGDGGASALASTLKKNTSTLAFLFLSWNKIGDEGASALADARTKNTTLKDLDLDLDLHLDLDLDLDLDLEHPQLSAETDERAASMSREDRNLSTALRRSIPRREEPNIPPAFRSTAHYSSEFSDSDNDDDSFDGEDSFASLESDAAEDDEAYRESRNQMARLNIEKQVGKSRFKKKRMGFWVPFRRKSSDPLGTPQPTISEGSIMNLRTRARMARRDTSKFDDSSSLSPPTKLASVDLESPTPVMSRSYKKISAFRKLAGFSIPYEHRSRAGGPRADNRSTAHHSSEFSDSDNDDDSVHSEHNFAASLESRPWRSSARSGSRAGGPWADTRSTAHYTSEFADIDNDDDSVAEDIFAASLGGGVHGAPLDFIASKEAEAKRKAEAEADVKTKAVEVQKEATLYGVKMFESGKLEFETNNQSKNSLLMSSFREVDENKNAIGTSALLKESKFVCSHVDKDTELLKVFGDSKPSADDSGIAKGTHSYIETWMETGPDHKYSLKVNAHQVTAPGKAGTKIENIDLVRGDFMVTVELSKDASGSEAAGGSIELKIEMHTSGSRIRKIPGLEFAYYLGKGAQLDLTNRYFQSVGDSDEFEERFMPDGFPTLELDANDKSRCFVSLRFQQFGGNGKIFYDPWLRLMSNRDGKFRVYSNRDYPHRFPIPVNFGAKYPKVPLTVPIVNVIDGARRRFFRREPLEDLHYLIAFNGKEIEEFTGDQACLTIMDLFDKIWIQPWQKKIVFDVDISRIPPNDGEEEEKRKGEEEAEEDKITEVPIIAPKDCRVMISFNDKSAGEDAERLANYLTGKGHPTFCTRIYCPKNPGSWRIPTREGVKNCKYFIMLMTNGWQKSPECRDETNMAINRSVRGDRDDEERKLVFIPVWYEDFDFDFDGRTEGEGYDLRFSSIQAIYHNTSDNWMEKILDLLV